MNYLKQNLDNSLILPYDIMLSIYEYADYFGNIRNQIETIDNINNYLDDIMYEKMKKHLLKYNLNNIYGSYSISNFVHEINQYDRIIITLENINDITNKDKLLNWNHGYKDFFLWKNKLNKICGIRIQDYIFNSRNYYLDYLRSEMRNHIINKTPELLYDTVNKCHCNIYKVWINL